MTDGGAPADLEFWKKRAERERRARLAAETVAETGTRQLYEKQRQLELLHLIASAANSAKSVEECIQNTLDHFCAYTGWPIGHAYFTTGEVPPILRSARLWHLDEPARFARFRVASEMVAFGAGDGLPGRILCSGRAAWIIDVRKDPNFPRIQNTSDLDVRGAFGFPIVVGNEVVAVLEFFSSQTEKSDEALLLIATHAGVQLGRVFERRQAEETIRASQARYRAVVENAPDFIQTVDRDGRILFINRVLPQYDQRAVINSSIYDYVPAETTTLLRQLVAEVFEHGVVRSYETSGPGPNGLPAWYAATLGPIKTNGQVTSAIIIAADITARKQADAELAALNKRLIETSRAVGMAEIATGVLHNVGNVLNSVNVSVTLVLDGLRKSRIGNLLIKTGELLQEHRDRLGDFFTNDPRARQLPAFFRAVADDLAKEQTVLREEMQRLQRNIDHVKQIVAAQQAFAKVSGVMERLEVGTLVEEGLSLASGGLARHCIEVVRDFQPVPTIVTDRHKVLQILINLIANAKHALEDRGEGRRLVLRISIGTESAVKIDVVDNGSGIRREDLTRIFQHGFTTKKTGHGFGLHSGANAARELGGSLTAYSDGPGYGATFTLELPIAREKAQVRADTGTP